MHVVLIIISGDKEIRIVSKLRHELRPTIVLSQLEKKL